jgi:hypothetical protein
VIEIRNRLAWKMPEGLIERGLNSPHPMLGRLVRCHGGCGEILGLASMELGYIVPRYGCATCAPARDPAYVAGRIVDSWVANGYRFIRPLLHAYGWAMFGEALVQREQAARRSEFREIPGNRKAVAV